MQHVKGRFVLCHEARVRCVRAICVADGTKETPAIDEAPLFSFLFLPLAKWQWGVCWLGAGVIDLATRGAALAFVTLMFPDEAWPWAQRAAVVGVGSSLFLAGRRSAKLHGWHLPRRPSFHVDLSSHRALQQGAPRLLPCVPAPPVHLAYLSRASM